MKTLKQLREEFASAVSVGSAAVAGMPTASPPEQTPVPAGVTTKGHMLRRKPPAMFAGKAVFDIPADKYHEAVMKNGKSRYDRYKRWGDQDGSMAEYARRNPGTPIIVSDSRTGALTYLRHGKNK